MKLKYERETSTVRTAPGNHCVCAFRLFSAGGSTDAAIIDQTENIGTLFAAAPEMLEQLKLVREYLAARGIQWTGIDAAIAKAEGKE